MLQLARRCLHEVSEVRLEKVAALQRAIQQGAYRIDPGKISSALLGSEDLDLASLMSRHPALIPEHVTLHGRNAIRELLLILETRDHFSGQHCARAAAIALRFARYLKLPRADLEALQTAAQLHDLGKIEIGKTILLKKKPLTAVDRAIIESHPGTGVRIARPLSLDLREQEIILHHHERWDGQGYPDGLAGEQIPFLCRLMALADVFEALTSDRPRRPRFPEQQALGIIRDRAGSQFDPYLAKRFLRMHAKRKSG
ncbi:MAG: HD domain-containing protein [Deltaproteobacteria bacterium]|nr:HD domain-containing protein [Deltaproteobacteria bacterium]